MELFTQWNASRLVRLASCAVAVAAAAAMSGATGAGAAERRSAAQVNTAASRTEAAAAAASFVASRPAAIHAGPDDEFVARPVISSMGWQYVPYERTYRGLPVIGGDFVVVVDPAGRVSSVSVAQRRPVKDLAVTPKVTLAQAQKVAAGQLRSVAKVEGGRLVVFALGAAPRLAWESTVDGTDAEGPAARTVIVDAVSGAALDNVERVRYDTGTGAYNGPNPLPIAASSSWLGIRVLDDPVTAGLRCGDWATKNVFTSFDSHWGNGSLTNLETQCVDAMFAAQTQVKMLNAWLGRNGVDGSGGAFPMYVGANFDNAMFAIDHLEFGFDPETLRPYTTLDIVGHELGHAIDYYTPGGFSRKGTSEFAADVFGTATEWYANEPAQYDEPDYMLGEEATVQPTNQTSPRAFRYMYYPGAQFGYPSCYYPAVDTMEVHAASGPGDHWFYLLAEGTDPTNGQPKSLTCNNTKMRGVGLIAATQILYHAMLMKTSDSSYQAYRKWTLTAAKNLFPGNCGIFNTVRAAWEAVSVPAQAGEPACYPGTATVLSGNANGGGSDITVLATPWSTIPTASSNGDGTFTVTNAVSADFTAWSQVPGVRILNGDFNKDGRSDLALLPGPDTPWWYTIPVAFANGDGSYTVTNKESTQFTDWVQEPGVQVVTADFNKDGRTDIALLPGADTAWGGAIPVALSKGDGSFTVTNKPSTDFAGWSKAPGARVLSGDFNKDGRADMALLPGPNTPWWYTIPVAFSKGDGSFTITNKPSTDFASWAQAPGMRVLSGDFNNDRRTDIALLPGPDTTWGSPIPVALSKGDGTFTVMNAASAEFGQWAKTHGVRLVTGDFNGDGGTDIALVPGPTTTWWTTIPVAFANTDGTFTVTNAASEQFAEWAQAPGAQVVGGDFNADGRTDIALTGGAGWTTVPVAFSKADGGFTVTNAEVSLFPMLATM